MKNLPKNPRVRLHISPETVASLERTRKLYGNKSWDDFFNALVQRYDFQPIKSPARLEAQDVKLALTKLDDIRQTLLQGMARLERRVMDKETATQTMAENLATELEQFTSTLNGIKTLLAIGLNAELPEEEGKKGKAKATKKEPDVLSKFLDSKL